MAQSNPLKISSLSLEYIRVPISAMEAGVVQDPTLGNDPQFAFMMDKITEPTAPDWTTGAWETAGSTYYARILVGPGGTKVLTDDVYFVWVKLDDSPEGPVRQVGLLTVT